MIIEALLVELDSTSLVTFQLSREGCLFLAYQITLGVSIEMPLIKEKGDTTVSTTDVSYANDVTHMCFGPIGL